MARQQGLTGTANLNPGSCVNCPACGQTSTPMIARRTQKKSAGRFPFDRRWNHLSGELRRAAGAAAIPCWEEKGVEKVMFLAPKCWRVQSQRLRPCTLKLDQRTCQAQGIRWTRAVRFLVIQNTRRKNARLTKPHGERALFFRPVLFQLPPSHSFEGKHHGRFLRRCSERQSCSADYRQRVTAL